MYKDDIFFALFKKNNKGITYIHYIDKELEKEAFFYWINNCMKEAINKLGEGCYLENCKIISSEKCEKSCTKK